VQRVGARVLLLDGGGHVLLIHERIHGGTHWLTPGGGREPGESLQQAAVREVYEETGIRVRLDPALDPVHTYRRAWQWDGVTYDQTDHFFLAQVPSRPDLQPAALTAMEHQTLLGHRWWSTSELRAANDTFEPAELADILERLAPPGRLTPPAGAGA
jgi:8-oxo-dGTP pyrophosphatase MutT (NUDIX family)